MDIKSKRADKKFELAILDYINSKKIELSDDNIHEILSIFKEIKMDIIKSKDTKKKDNEQFMLSILDFANSKNIILSDEEIKNLVQKIKLNIDNYIKENKEIKIINSMVFVKGGKYKPSCCDEEKEVFDLEVGKYPVTQKLYQEIMGYNPSYFNGKNRPIENISWWQALVFCNKLSEKYNLAPVYDLVEMQDGKLKINQLNGETVSPDKADFKDTEGFRLPTIVEWEWFARGGEIAIQNGTFNYKYSGSNIIEEVAWYKKNSKNKTYDVGLKKANQLGLYDCSGNVLEWCYDTTVFIKGSNESQDIKKGKLYIYSLKKNVKHRELRGGCYYDNDKNCGITNIFTCDEAISGYRYFGFRVVKTI